MANTAPLRWIVEKLEGNKKIQSTNIDENRVLYVNKINGVQLGLIVSPLEVFTLMDIKPLADLSNINFILHTCKEPDVSGDVFEYLDSKHKVLGYFGDALDFIEQDNHWPYVNRDVRYIKRGLDQHTKVSNFRRLDNKRYEISRYDIETVTIVALNDYDLGIESIRSAIEKYGKFDAVLRSNPSGRTSTAAFELSRSLGIKVLAWGELLGELNYQWT